jgi:anti-sigma B factor antagonist
MGKVRTPVLIQRLPQRFNAAQVRAIMQELQSFLRADRPRLVFDLSQVEEMDAASVDMLLQCMSEASKRDGDVKLASPSVRAMVILELTQLDRLFEIFENPEEASASFGGPFTASQTEELLLGIPSPSLGHLEAEQA